MLKVRIIYILIKFKNLRVKRVDQLFFHIEKVHFPYKKNYTAHRESCAVHDKTMDFFFTLFWMRVAPLRRALHPDISVVVP